MKQQVSAGSISKLSDFVIDVCYNDITGELTLIRKSGKKSLIKGFSSLSEEEDEPVFSNEL